MLKLILSKCSVVIGCRVSLSFQTIEQLKSICKCISVRATKFSDKLTSVCVIDKNFHSPENEPTEVIHVFFATSEYIRSCLLHISCSGCFKF